LNLADTALSAVYRQNEVELVKQAFDSSDLDSIFAYLDREAQRQPSPHFENAIAAVAAHIESGTPDIAGVLGRVLITPGRCHDAAAAYRWFYIGLSEQGYLTDYSNAYEAGGTSYLGPAGDFRNEDEVAICIAELGLRALPELDAKAQSWLESRV